MPDDNSLSPVLNFPRKAPLSPKGRFNPLPVYAKSDRYGAGGFHNSKLVHHFADEACRKLSQELPSLDRDWLNRQTIIILAFDAGYPIGHDRRILLPPDRANSLIDIQENPLRPPTPFTDEETALVKCFHELNLSPWLIGDHFLDQCLGLTIDKRLDDDDIARKRKLTRIFNEEYITNIMSAVFVPERHDDKRPESITAFSLQTIAPHGFLDPGIYFPEPYTSQNTMNEQPVYILNKAQARLIQQSLNGVVKPQKIHGPHVDFPTSRNAEQILQLLNRFPIVRKPDQLADLMNRRQKIFLKNATIHPIGNS